MAKSNDNPRAANSGSTNPRSATSRGVGEPRPANMALTLATLGLVVAGLYFGREFLIPIALAVLLTFLLSPLSNRLERWGLNRIFSVVCVTLMSFAVLAVIGVVVGIQLADLADKLPSYSDNIHDKITDLRSRGGGGFFTKVTKVTEQISKDLSEPMPASRPATTQSATQAAGGAATAPTTQVAAQALNAEAPSTQPVAQAVYNLSGEPTTRPIQVEVVPRPPNPLVTLQQRLEPLIEPLGTAGIVIVFVVFMLIAREDLRDRLIRLVSRGDINLTTQAMDEASTRISSFLLMQLIVNVTYGIPIGVGLWLIGVPNAVLWGLLATLLRFIPYIGPWIAAVFPLTMAFAVDPGWWMLILTVGLFLGMELISNNVVEPWLYGKNTGISPVAVIVAAVFWTWLWGTPGLLLSTPLTVCLAVIGKYVPQLGYLNVILGDEPVLEPHLRVYQRLLVQDTEEAMDLVEEYLEEKSLVEVYDEVLIPALGKAELDQHRGRLDEPRHRYVRDGIRFLLDELADRKSVEVEQAKAAEIHPEEQNTGGWEKVGPRESEKVCVLCLPARDEADEIVAMMLAQVLETQGCRAEYVPAAALASEMVEAAAKHQAKVVCVSALPPSAATHARYLCKRLRARLGNLMLVVGLWTAKEETIQRARKRLVCEESDQIVSKLAEAVQRIQPIVATLTAGGEVTAPAGGGDGTPRGERSVFGDKVGVRKDAEFRAKEEGERTAKGEGK